MTTRMYIFSNYPTELKKKSLEDNVYFTLKNIFHNSSSYQTCMRANYFNGRLCGDIYYDDRTSDFVYQPVLQNKEYLGALCHFLNSLKETHFERFHDESEESQGEHDILFEEWWDQFNDLRRILNERHTDLVE